MLHCPLDEAADAVTEARVSVCVLGMLLYIPSFPDKESQFLVASRQYHTCWWHFIIKHPIDVIHNPQKSQ